MARAPTWLGLCPEEPVFSAASAGDVAAVRAALNLDGDLSELRTDSGHQKLFRLAAKSGKTYFVRIVEPAWASEAAEAEAIAAWLGSQGVVNVPVPLAGFPTRLPDGRLVSATGFIGGSRLMPSPGIMRRFGVRLAQLHELLSSSPEKAGWEQRTDRRLTRLSEVRADLASGRFECGPDPKRLAAFADDPAIDFVRLGEARQPLHGDLNAGNVIEFGGDVYFLDFEDVVHSVLPRMFELALVLERHVLVPLADDRAAVAAGIAFLEGYGAGPLEPSLTVAHLRALALRSLCVLANEEMEGRPQSGPEWAKFFSLEENARSRAETLARIGDGVEGKDR